MLSDPMPGVVVVAIVVVVVVVAVVVVVRGNIRSVGGFICVTNPIPSYLL